MNNIEWLWTMKKPQVPLAQGLHALSVPLIKKILDVKEDLPIKHVNGDIYFGKKGIEAMTRRLKEHIAADHSYPEKLQKKIKGTIDNLTQVVASLKKQNPKKKTDEELLELFFTGYQAIAKVTAFMSFKCTVEMTDVLEQEVHFLIRNKLREKGIKAMLADDVLLLFSLPKQESFMLQEQKSILLVAAERQKGKKTDHLLSEHTQKFAWMGVVMYAGKPFTRDHFEQEVQQALKLDCIKKREELEKQKNEREQKIAKLIEQLGFTDQEKRLLDQFREWAHLRTYVKDMTSVGMEVTLPFLEEIAKLATVSYEDVLHLSHTELQAIFSDKKAELMKESKLRQKGWGYLLVNGQEHCFNYITVEEIAENENTTSAGVRGSAAFKGIVRGKTVIVTSVQDFDRIKQGDILITHMTTTNFVPYLSKVAAIVTDEGGITCHAAIISREMQIPCVIGTRYATKAFRDGELVEVDANNGIVRRIT